jgi:hypothetical protein
LLARASDYHLMEQNAPAARAENGTDHHVTIGSEMVAA